MTKMMSSTHSDHSFIGGFSRLGTGSGQEPESGLLHTRKEQTCPHLPGTFHFIEETDSSG